MLLSVINNPLSSDDPFKSGGPLKDIMDMFPDFVAAEVEEYLAEGLPLEYVVRLLEAPFDTDGMISELNDIFILFSKILIQESATFLGKPLRKHTRAMERALPAFDKFPEKQASELMYVLLGSLATLSTQKVVLVSQIDGMYSSLDSPSFRKMGVPHGTGWKWIVRNLIVFLALATDKAGESESFFIASARLKTPFFRVRKLVSLYYTEEAKKVILAAAYKKNKSAIARYCKPVP